MQLVAQRAFTVDVESPAWTRFYGRFPTAYEPVETFLMLEPAYGHGVFYGVVFHVRLRFVDKVGDYLNPSGRLVFLRVAAGKAHYGVGFQFCEFEKRVVWCEFACKV